MVLETMRDLIRSAIEINVNVQRNTLSNFSGDASGAKGADRVPRKSKASLEHHARVASREIPSEILADGRSLIETTAFFIIIDTSRTSVECKR